MRLVLIQNCILVAVIDPKTPTFSKTGCSPTLFTPTFQYFYTDISAMSVTFRSSVLVLVILWWWDGFQPTFRSGIGRQIGESRLPPLIKTSLNRSAVLSILAQYSWRQSAMRCYHYHCDAAKYSAMRYQTITKATQCRIGFSSLVCSCTLHTKCSSRGKTVQSVSLAY